MPTAKRSTITYSEQNEVLISFTEKLVLFLFYRGNMMDDGLVNEISIDCWLWNSGFVDRRTCYTIGSW